MFATKSRNVDIQITSSALKTEDQGHILLYLNKSSVIFVKFSPFISKKFILVIWNSSFA